MQDFSEDHIDVLRELINIAVGSAIANIAELLQAFNTMRIPDVRIIGGDALAPAIETAIGKTDRNYVTKQLFAGAFHGETLFIITETSAHNLKHNLLQAGECDEDDLVDVVAELANILNATFVGKLTRELETEVQFFVPATRLVIGPNIITNDELTADMQVIIISTLMEFEAMDIQGMIYILTKGDSIDRLKQLIDRKLEALYA